jgi:hypothetical protein
MSLPLANQLIERALGEDATDMLTNLGVSWIAVSDNPRRHVLSFAASRGAMLVDDIALRVLSVIDGASNLCEVQSRMREVYDCPIAISALERLCTTWVNKGWVQIADEPSTSRLVIRRQSVAVLPQRIDVSVVVDKIYTHRRSLLHPLVLMLILSCIVYGLLGLCSGKALLIVSQQLGLAGMSGHLPVLVLAPVALVVIIGVHELAHAFALRCFDVPSCGARLLWSWRFFPTVRTDTSGLMFTEGKKVKLLVFLAGPLSDLCFIGFFMLVATLVPAKSGGADFASIIVAAMTIALSFNINPFMARTDGYWIVSYALGIADLGKVSRTALNQMPRTLFDRVTGRVADRPRPMFWLALWGLLALAVNTSLFSLILLVIFY